MSSIIEETALRAQSRSLSTNYIKPPNAELRLERLHPELFRDVRRESKPPRVFRRVVGAMLKSSECSRKKLTIVLGSSVSRLRLADVRDGGLWRSV